MTLGTELTELYEQLMVGCLQLVRFHEMTLSTAQELVQEDTVPSEALRTLRQFLEDSSEPTLTLQLEETGETITFSRSEASQLLRLTTMGLDIEVGYPRIANDMMLIYLTTLFEAYVLDAIRAVMDDISQQVRRSGTARGQRILDEDTVRLLVRLIRRQVRDLEFGSIQTKLRFLESTLGVSLEGCPPAPAELDELYATRNLLVHNRGVVNRRYLEMVPSSTLRVGEARRVDDDYIVAAVTAVRTWGDHLHRALLSRYAPEMENRLADIQRLMAKLSEVAGDESADPATGSATST